MGGGMKGKTLNETDLKWLVGTPATDSNFTSALQHANEVTIRAAIEAIEGAPLAKTKELALRRQLRVLDRNKGKEAADAAAVATADRQLRTTELELATLQDERGAEDLRSVEQKERERLIAQCHETIGRIQGVGMIGKLATVASLVWLSQVKETKIYKDIPSIGSWEKFCESVGMSRRKVDEDLQNLSAFGEDFLATVASFNVGYRELRQLRQLTYDGTVAVDAECITIGGERIPIDEDHHDDLQLAIERILEDKLKMNDRVEKLEKNLDGAVKEETKGLKAEVKALVREVRRLKPFDPEEKDISFAADQLQDIKDSVLCSVAMISRFIVDERVQKEPVIMGQVEGHLQTVELALSDLRRRWEQAVNLFEA